MTQKKAFTKIDKDQIKYDGIIEWDGNYIDEDGTERNAVTQIETAEAEIRALNYERQTKNVHFRWSEYEIDKAKKIASHLGLKYQTYIKMKLKEIISADIAKYNL